MKKKLLVLIAGVVLFACGNVSSSDKKTSEEKSVKEKAYKYASMKDGVLHLDLNEARKHREQMKLSDICDSLIYIPLETKKESLLGGVSEVKVDGDDVFIYYYWGLYHFKINGDFVGQIGRKGRGPGEYICTGFCLNKKDKKVYAMANYKRKLLEFSYDGDLLNEDVPVVDYFNTIKYYDNRNSFITTHSYELQTSESLDSLKYTLFKERDIKGNILFEEKSKTFPKNDVKKGLMGMSITGARIEFFGDEYRIQEAANDTIFNVKGREMKPMYILNNKLFKKGINLENYRKIIFDGDRIKTKKQRNSPENEKIRHKTYFNSINGESDRYLFIGNLESYVYDKKERCLKMLSDNLLKEKAFVNDMDGVITSCSGKLINNEYMLYIVPADTFIEKYTSVIESDDKHIKPDYRKRVKSILANMTEESNPVLVLARLKK